MLIFSRCCVKLWQVCCWCGQNTTHAHVCVCVNMDVGSCSRLCLSLLPPRDAGLCGMLCLSMDASSVVLGQPHVLRLVSCGRERCAKCCTVVSLDLSRRQSLSLFLFELLCSNSFALLGTFGLRKFGRHIHRCMNRMSYCLVTIVCLLGLFLFFLDG